MQDARLGDLRNSAGGEAILAKGASGDRVHLVKLDLPFGEFQLIQRLIIAEPQTEATTAKPSKAPSNVALCEMDFAVRMRRARSAKCEVRSAKYKSVKCLMSV